MCPSMTRVTLDFIHPNLHKIMCQVDVWSYVHSKFRDTNLFNITLLLYPKTLGDGCSQFKCHALLSSFLPMYQGF